MDIESLIPAPVQTRIRLWCEGGSSFGTVINNRWLEVPCRDKRCRRVGVQTVHRWDLQTGQHSTVYRELSPGTGDTSQGAQ